jgi:hypothetical protein
MIAAMVGLATVGILNLSGTHGIDEAELPRIQEQMDQVPLNLPGWIGKTMPTDPKVMQVAQARAFHNREYRHSETGATVRVLLMYGPSGDQGAHDPEVCYAGIGFQRTETPFRVELPRGLGQLWSARFTRKEPESELRLLWGWGDAEGWQAHEYPRLALASRRGVYKIYVQSANTTKIATLSSFFDPYFAELARGLKPSSR